MFVSSHERFGDFVLTYVNGDNFDAEHLAAATDIENDKYMVSNRINQKNRPLNKLLNTEYGEEVTGYVEKVQITQLGLDILGKNVKNLEEVLEEDSHNPADVEKRLEELSNPSSHERPKEALSDGGYSDGELTDQEIAERKEEFFY